MTFNEIFNEAVTKIFTEMPYGMGDSIPVTRQQFIETVEELDREGNGTDYISFTAVVDALPKKTGNDFRNVYKVYQTNGTLGFNYEANVNSRRAKEGKTPDFVKQQSKTMREWLSDSIGITNTGKTVIRYRLLTKSDIFYVVVTNIGTVEQKTKEELAAILRPPTDYGKYQGVDQGIAYTTFGVDNIIGAALNKQEYLISDVDEVRKKAFELVKNQLPHRQQQ